VTHVVVGDGVTELVADIIPETTAAAEVLCEAVRSLPLANLRLTM
jgi:hypothetical protein